MVVIVDNPDIGLAEGNLIARTGKSRCKHLRGEIPGKYQCAIHNKRWFNRTPCFAHGQIEKNINDVCRMGEFIIGSLTA